MNKIAAPVRPGGVEGPPVQRVPEARINSQPNAGTPDPERGRVATPDQVNNTQATIADMVPGAALSEFASGKLPPQVGDNIPAGSSNSGAEGISHLDSGALVQAETEHNQNSSKFDISDSEVEAYLAANPDVARALDVIRNNMAEGGPKEASEIVRDILKGGRQDQDTSGASPSEETPATRESLSNKRTPAGSDKSGDTVAKAKQAAKWVNNFGHKGESKKVPVVKNPFADRVNNYDIPDDSNSNNWTAEQKENYVRWVDVRDRVFAKGSPITEAYPSLAEVLINDDKAAYLNVNKEVLSNLDKIFQNRVIKDEKTGKLMIRDQKTGEIVELNAQIASELLFSARCAAVSGETVEQVNADLENDDYVKLARGSVESVGGEFDDFSGHLREYASATDPAKKEEALRHIRPYIALIHSNADIITAQKHGWNIPSLENPESRYKGMTLMQFLLMLAFVVGDEFINATGVKAMAQGQGKF